jgi:single-strand DNA-binding protein
MDYNKVSFICYVSRDPELRFNPEGKAFSKFGIAINETKDKAFFANVTAWEKLAELVNESIHKGSRVFVEGKLTTPGAWINKDDNTPRASIEVTANTVIFLDKKE